MMTIEDHGDWLPAKADFPACPGIPAWHEVLTCKVPPTQCECLLDTDTWKVHRRHRQLLVTLEAIYQTLTDPDPCPVMLRQVPKMLECIGKWYPVGDQVQLAIRDHLGFPPEETGTN